MYSSISLSLYFIQWTQLTTRRKNLTRLFEKMQNFLSERYLDAEKNVDKSFRPITEQDLDRYFFFFYYSVYEAVNYNGKV